MKMDLFSVLGNMQYDETDEHDCHRPPREYDVVWEYNSIENPEVRWAALLDLKFVERVGVAGFRCTSFGYACMLLEFATSRAGREFTEKYDGVAARIDLEDRVTVVEQALLQFAEMASNSVCRWPESVDETK